MGENLQFAERWNNGQFCRSAAGSELEIFGSTRSNSSHPDQSGCNREHPGEVGYIRTGEYNVYGPGHRCRCGRRGLFAVDGHDDRTTAQSEGAWMKHPLASAWLWKTTGPRRAAALTALATIAAAVVLVVGADAGAAIHPTVLMGTAANYSVLGASTVTNTNGSVLYESLGLWPGTSIVGFPPGKVVPPATTDTTNAAAHQAQSDLTAAYGDAAGRPVDANTTADLTNLHLGAGVYAGPSHSALGLSGPLVLDGAGNASSVFIFQTDSTLITGSASTVTLVNGAQACNVFWQVGSSATLGTGSVFVGNILALTSITVNNSVTVQGRALARNGAVTLDDDTFIAPSCATSVTTTTTAPVVPGPTTTTTTTVPTLSPTTTTVPPTVVTTPGTPGSPGTPAGGSPTTPATSTTPGTLPGNSPTTPATPTTPGTPAGSSSSTTPGSTNLSGPTPPAVVGFPRTDGGPARTPGTPWVAIVVACLLGGCLATGALWARRAR
jgi:hypothetical protein